MRQLCNDHKQWRLVSLQLLASPTVDSPAVVALFLTRPGAAVPLPPPAVPVAVVPPPPAAAAVEVVPPAAVLAGAALAPGQAAAGALNPALLTALGVAAAAAAAGPMGPPLLAPAPVAALVGWGMGLCRKGEGSMSAQALEPDQQLAGAAAASAPVKLPAAAGAVRLRSHTSAVPAIDWQGSGEWPLNSAVLLGAGLLLTEGSYCVSVGTPELYKVLHPPAQDAAIAGAAAEPDLHSQAAALAGMKVLELVVVEDGVVMEGKLAAEMYPLKARGTAAAASFR